MNPVNLPLRILDSLAELPCKSDRHLASSNHSLLRSKELRKKMQQYLLMKALCDKPIRERWFCRLIPATFAAAMFCAGLSAHAQTCDPAPSGIVSWWAGESNALDNYGINNGAFTGTPTYAPGKVGTAFSFDGSTRYVRVPNSASQQVSTITVEAWVFPTAYNPQSGAIICKYDGGVTVGQSAYSYHQWRVNGEGAL